MPRTRVKPLPSRPLKFIVGLVAALLAAGATVVLAAGSPERPPTAKAAVTKAAAPKVMKVACARDGGGKLQFLPVGTTSCKGEVIRFPQDAPVTACQLDKGNSNIYEAKTKLAPPAHKHAVVGMLFVVSGPGKCKPPKYPDSHARKLPSTTKNVRLCAGRRRGTVRVVNKFSQCNDLEFSVVLQRLEVNHKPTANAQSVSVEEDGAKPITLTGSDPDGDSLTFTIASGPAHGNLTGAGKNRVYHPNANFTGADSFTFQVADGHGGTDTAKVTIQVTAGNDPPVVSTSAGSTAYSENASGVEIDDGLTVTDADDADLEDAMVSITGGFQSGDTLEFGNQNGITGTYNSGTGILTLTGSASVADYQAALRSVKFSSTSDAPQTSKTVRFRVGDGDDDDDSNASKTVTVTPVNDAPTVDASAGALSYTEGDGAKAVDATVVVDDPDSANLSGAVVKIASGFVQAEDELSLSAPSGITASYDDPTGTLTLSGSATRADYQTALRSVKYENSSANPSTATRTVSFKVTDDGSADSGTDTKNIDVAAANTKPSVVTSSGSTIATEDAATTIDGALTVADPDNTHLEHAQVRIAVANFQPGDELIFADQAGIVGDWDDTTGLLKLDGHATLSDYQTALRSVKFKTTNNNPSSAKTIGFTVNDGNLDSLTSNKSVTVNGVDDAPTVLTSVGTAGYTEGGTAATVDPNVDVDDPDSNTIIEAKVSVTNFAAGDTLAATTPAGITPSYDSGTGVLTLSGAGTVAAYETALRSVKFSTISDDPPTATRTVSFQVSQSGLLVSNTDTRDVTVAKTNDAPVVDNSTGSTSYSEGAAGVVVDSTVTVTDADNANIAGATVSITGGYDSGDTLEFTDTATIDGDYVPGNGVLTLTGNDTVAAYQAALRSIKFSSTSDTPTTPKSISFKVFDGLLDSNVDSKGIDVTAVNDPPELDTTNANLSYTEGDGKVAIDPGVTVDEPESQQIKSATVQITTGFVQADDELSFSSPSTPNITGVYDDSTGTLTLTGNDSAADYALALRAVKFENLNTNPSGSKTVTFKAKDASDAESAGATRTIDLQNANTAPTVTTTGTALSYSEGDGATVVDGGLTVTDPDSTQIQKAVVRMATNYQTGDVLSFVNQLGITGGTYDTSTGTLELTGTASLSDYQTALRTVKYEHTTDNPGASKSVGFVVRDAEGKDSSESVRAINVTGVNDAPTINVTGTNLGFSEGGAPVSVDDQLDLIDADSQIQSASVQLTGNFVQADDELTFDNTATPSITGTYDDTTGTMALSGTASVDDYETAFRNVKYQNTSQNPSGSKTVTFKAKDAPGADSNAPTRTIDLTGVNDLPVVTTTAGSTSYTEGQATPPAVDGGVTVSDVDDTTLSRAEVSISSGLQTGDVLACGSCPAGITPTYTPGTGVLELVGTDSVANYEAALKSVTYSTTNPNPSSPKVVTFKAKDGVGFSAGATKSISITGVNTAPTISTTVANLPYSEGAGPKAADPNVTAADPDSTNLSSAKVTISGNFVAADDELASAGNANITPSYNDTTGVLTLTGTDTVAAYNAVLQAVTYENVSQNPSGTKTLSFEVTDDGTLASNTATRTVDLTAVNDAPVITPTNGSTAYTEGDPPKTVDSGVTVSDVDDTNLASGQVRISSGFQTGDVLSFTAPGGSGITGLYNPSTGVLSLSGTSSVANYQSTLQSIQFVSTNPAPVTSKTVEFRVTDPHTTDSNLPTKEIAVTPVNSPPTVDATNAALTFTEGDAATFVDSGLNVSEPEGDSLTGGSASITGNYQSGEDVLSWTDNSMADLIGLSVTSTDQTIVLTGPGSAAEYQAALRNVKYGNASENPSNLTRTVTFSATDTLAATGSDTRSINVAPVDDLPVASNDAATLLEDAAATDVPVLTNDIDVDGGPKTISSKTNPANGTVTITGGGTGLTYKPNADYCNSPDATPSATPDTFTYTLNASANPAQTATVSMTVTCVNDAPVVTGETLSGANAMIGNTKHIGNDPSDGAPSASDPHKTVTADILANDTDVDGPGPLIVQDTDGTPDSTDHRTSNLGGSVTIESDGDFVYSAPTTTNAANPTATNCDDATDSFQYTVSDQNPGTAGTNSGTVTLNRTNCVWYVNNNDPSGNGGTSDKPYDTLASADTASPPGDAIYVFKGTGTTTGYDTGVDLAANQKLIGEAATLTIGTDTLKAGDPTKRPLITDTANDVVVLDDANEVKGLDIDPQGANNGGIAGGSGDASGTIDDVNVSDTSPFGTGPGLELDGTSGTWNVSNLAVTNGDGSTATDSDIGIDVNSAGTVNFLPSGVISVNTNGAKALDLTGASTNMGSGSVFDSVTSSGSDSGGVNMNATTGTTTIGDGAGTDLSLTTTAGAPAALSMNNPGTVSVPGGTASVSATGGPAVDVSNAPNVSLPLGTVQSLNSANDGINWDNNSGSTFSAQSGGANGITGAQGIAIDVHGGNGNLLYPGTLGDGTGQTAEVTGRTGGSVDLTGAINDGTDAGGGITVGGAAGLSNTGGVTAFNNGTKTIDTRTTSGTAAQNDAIVFTNSPGHTLTLTGGGLNVDSTGRGLQADSSGTLNVSGSGNSINSLSGIALDVTSTTIGSTLQFHDISAGNNTAAADPANGIKLTSTGATAGLTVAGGGSTAQGGDASGGTIQRTTDDAVSMNTTQSPSLNNLTITSPQHAGVEGRNVHGFSYTNGTVSGVGAAANDPNHDSSITFDDATGGTNNNVDGALTINNNVLSNAYVGGVDVEQYAGTLSNVQVNDNAISSSSLPANSKGNGIQFLLSGSAGGVANITTATIQNNNVTNFPSGHGIAVLGGNVTNSGAPSATLGTPTGTPGSSGNAVKITGNRITGDATNKLNSDGILASLSGRGQGRFSITNNGTVANPITNIKGLPINIGAAGTQSADFEVTGNRIVANGELGSNGIGLGLNKWTQADLSVQNNVNANVDISNNNVSQSSGAGIRAILSDATVNADLKVNNNTVGAPIQGNAGIRVESGSSAGTGDTLCAQISGNSSTGSVDGFGDTHPGIELFKRTSAVFGIVGLSPSPATAAQTETFVAGLNPSSAPGAGDPLYAGKKVTVRVGTNFTSCTLPF